jgi:predicted dehydrogenase
MGRRARVVLAGCGGISHCWLDSEAVKKRVAVVGLVDVRPEKACAVQARYGLSTATVGVDLGAVLEATRPVAVFDCTVPEAHVEVTLTALKRGCHVLGEKPLSDSMAHARTMVRAAEKAGLVYAVIQNRRYDPNIRRLKALLDSGVLGDITTLTSDFFIGAHFGGFRDAMQHVLLLDMAIHTFDAARYLSGANAKRVLCHEWNPKGSWYAHGASAVAVFEMSGGVVYTYQGSWCSEGLHTAWESSWRIVGTKGSVTWDGADGFRGEVVKKTGGFHSAFKPVKMPPVPRAARVGHHSGVIHDFLDAIEGGPRPETIASDNIHSLAMVHGAIASAGKRVVCAV